MALDGSGRNSPFTAALLHYIDSEGESISDVMITGQFFFKPAPAKTAYRARLAA